ncbi:hypothetical protein SERLA73DRAFT_175627 [Serpula lacrymans var. lacrymans S7.3]|uniref:Uncharacterized protein n=2 Tax=Serpula lacrymans var. lacrymans TaxID=341189 RepID=F8PL21_SERL3|nr:uncharacterized protein SERLADRAFT_445629 [Serpula lacrymans var. lacrymans S7.9]EGO03929.1 hypothetical protein SERLA73DRAFT_175627 [Serpula lacrymans var. lacrymans S7.3]EGO29853.1 hypothetical protein SERLADRAFT_445629 [Serpula lacrymans var. lacrymans S7.9]
MRTSRSKCVATNRQWSWLMGDPDTFFETCQWNFIRASIRFLVGCCGGALRCVCCPYEKNGASGSSHCYWYASVLEFTSRLEDTVSFVCETRFRLLSSCCCMV